MEERLPRSLPLKLSTLHGIRAMLTGTHWDAMRLERIRIRSELTPPVSMRPWFSGSDAARSKLNDFVLRIFLLHRRQFQRVASNP